MDIVGQDVRHKVFGIGTVIEMDQNLMVVRFSAGMKKFAYPSAFEEFLTPIDASVFASIQLEIAAWKQAKSEAEQQARDDFARKVAEIELASQKPIKRKTERSSSPRSTSPKSSTAKSSTSRSASSDSPSAGITLSGSSSVDASQATLTAKPVKENRATYFIFQGNTFDRQYRGGYIWAPVHDPASRQFSYGENLFEEVREGDVIFHGCNGLIAAVSCAKQKCHEALQPVELLSEKLWGNEGHQIDCDYALIQNPVKTSVFRDEIKKYSSGKDSPFDKHGNGNTGYFYRLDRKLAKIFLKTIVTNNYELNDLTFVKDLISD